MSNDITRTERIRALYGSPEENNPVWDAISPKTYVDRFSVPVMLFQGSRDESVPQAWSDKTVALLRSKDKSIEYVVYEDEAHEFGPKWNDFMNRTAIFFKKYLIQQTLD